jgi:hypothetical protein
MHTVSLLGICGSPREHGNSRYLLQHAATCWPRAAPMTPFLDA